MRFLLHYILDIIILLRIDFNMAELIWNLKVTFKPLSSKLSIFFITNDVPFKNSMSFLAHSVLNAIMPSILTCPK